MDTRQFTELIRRHAGLLHKVAFAYCRQPADREDVVQEIAAQLWRARDRYDDRYQETTWIYRIAINVAISYHRRERRHRDWVSIDEQLIAVPAAEPDPDVGRLLGWIDALGALERALVLLYLDGHDHAAIADVLGISVSNVGTRLARIKDRLRAGTERQTHGAR